MKYSIKPKYCQEPINVYKKEERVPDAEQNLRHERGSIKVYLCNKHGNEALPQKTHDEDEEKSWVGQSSIKPRQLFDDHRLRKIL